MIYVPILKTRKTEYQVAKEIQYCFSESIIPMFEIISEVIEETDTKNIKTLPNINAIVSNKNVFIDYFRYSTRKYGKDVDIRKAELSFDLSKNYNLYKEKVLSVSAYPNMIPVISIKKDFEIPENEMRNFVKELQSKNNSIALRITEEFLGTYGALMKETLRDKDYVLFDIEEQAPETKFMEIEELNDLGLNTQIILINSPRKLAIDNGQYPEHGVTDLIDNSARTVANANELDGYGDYCGLKDKMPEKSGGNGKGTALALFYDFVKNLFYSYSNHDTTLGVQGYYTLIPLIMGDEAILNPLGDCPGFKKMRSIRSGNWCSWHYINAVRYIYQTYKNL